MKKEQKKEKKKKKSIFRGILKFLFVIILLIVFVILGFVVYSTYKNGWGAKGMLATIVGQDQEKLKDLDRIDVLILGISTDISVKLTDTIIVASYDPKTQTASMISIPRDTFIGNNKNNADSYDKINALYQKGIEKTLDAVNELTGMDIKYYVVVDTEALVELVDTIGGVEFDVPIDMDYDDSSQKLYIHLKKGLQTLDGEQAEHLVRFRKNNDGTTYPAEYGDNDTGRMRTQREFLTEVLKQTIKFKNILKIRELVDIAYKYIETNISIDIAKDYVPYIIDFDTENLKTATLPGVNDKLGSLWFFVANKKETVALIEEFYPTVIEETVEIDGENKEETTSAKDFSKIKVEILNGSGSESKLAEAEKVLTNKGYSVYKTSDTTSTSKTTIINKSNQTEEVSNNLKEVLGVGNITKSSSSSNVDFTIILGKDYN